MALSLRSLLKKLQGGVDAIRKPLPPPVNRFENFKPQNTRQRQFLQESRNALQDVNVADYNANPAVSISNTLQNARIPQASSLTTNRIKNPYLRVPANIALDVAQFGLTRVPNAILAGVRTGARTGELAYDAMQGRKIKGTQVLNAAAPIGEGILDYMTPKAGKTLASAAFKSGAKRTVYNVGKGLTKEFNKAGLRAIPYGAAYGALQGIQENKDQPTTLHQLALSWPEALAGGVGAYALGGALGAGSKFVGSAVNQGAKTKSRNTLEYLRDAKGHYQGSRVVNNQRGAIEVGTLVPKPLRKALGLEPQSGSSTQSGSGSKLPLSSPQSKTVPSKITLPELTRKLDDEFVSKKKSSTPSTTISGDILQQSDEPFLGRVINKAKQIQPITKEEKIAQKTLGYTSSQKILADSKQVKDKLPILYQRETLLRNIEDTFKNKGEATKIKNEFVRPIVKNETSNVLFKNNLKKELGKVFKGFGIKKGSDHDMAAADFIEGNKSSQEMKPQFPNTWQGIVQASEKGREVYRTLLGKINESITKHGYEPIPERQNYVTHTRQLETFGQRIGNLLNLDRDKLPTYISSINVETKPGRQYFGFGKQRKGGSTHEGLITALEKYIEPAGNQIFHTEDIQRGRQLQKTLMDTGILDQSDTRLSNFTDYLGQYVNSLAGKKNIIDRPFEKVLGRSVLRFGDFLRKRTGANMVGGNISSALTNFIPLTQSLATTSKPAAAQGLYHAALSPSEGLTSIAGQVSSFLTRRFPENYIVPTTGQKVGQAANVLFKMVDGFTSKAIVAGKYFEGVSKGLDPKTAMAAADEYAARIITDRSFGQIPLLFNSKVLGAFTQFQAEVNNQLSVIGKDIPKNLGFSKAQVVSSLTQAAIYSFLYNQLAQQVTGRKPALDPLGAVLQTYQDIQDGKGAQAFNPADQNTGAGQLVGNIPFVGSLTGGRIPIGSSLPNPISLLKGESTIGQELKKPLYNLLPPFGGAQIKKTVEGLDAYQRGASVTPSGKARFDIEQTPANLARTAVFGQYSVPEARKYFNDPKSVNVTNVEPILSVTPAGKISVKGGPAPSIFGNLKDNLLPEKPKAKEKISETLDLLKQGVIDKDAAKSRIRQALLQDAVTKLNKGDKTALTPLLLQELKKGLKSDITSISKDPELTIEEKKKKIKTTIEVFKKTVGKQASNIQPIKTAVNILPSLGPITGLDGSSAWKWGLDVDLVKGQPVPTPVSGTVVASRYNGGFGNQVKIQGDDGLEYWFSHLSRGIEPGGRVQAGQTIGLGGNTGNVIPGPGGDGSHLDLTVLKDGRYIPARSVAQLLKSYS